MSPQTQLSRELSSSSLKTSLTSSHFSSPHPRYLRLQLALHNHPTPNMRNDGLLRINFKNDIYKACAVSPKGDSTVNWKYWPNVSQGYGGVKEHRNTGPRTATDSSLSLGRNGWGWLLARFHTQAALHFPKLRLTRPLGRRSNLQGGLIVTFESIKWFLNTISHFSEHGRGRSDRGNWNIPAWVTVASLTVNG